MSAVPPLSQLSVRPVLAFLLIGVGVVGLGVASASRLVVHGGAHVASGTTRVTSSACAGPISARYETADLAADGSVPVTDVVLDGLDSCAAGLHVSATLFDDADQVLASTVTLTVDGSDSNLRLALLGDPGTVTNHDVARIGVVVR